jgi:hypothetical protein
MTCLLVIAFWGGEYKVPMETRVGEITTEQLCIATGQALTRQMILEIPDLTVMFTCTPGQRT